MAVVLIRLWMGRLHLRYRWFTLYVAYSIVEVFALILTPRKTSAYAYLFLTVEGLKWFLHGAILVELFTTMVRRYPGIAKTGRRFIAWAVCLAIAGSLAFAWLHHDVGPKKFPILQVFFLIERVVSFIIIILLALMIVFLRWFSVSVNRNCYVFLIGYSVYFCGRGLTHFASNLFGPDLFQHLSAIALGLGAIAWGLWAASLSPAGESSRKRVGGRPIEDEEKMMRQLESINATLLGSQKS